MTLSGVVVEVFYDDSIIKLIMKRPTTKDMIGSFIMGFYPPNATTSHAKSMLSIFLFVRCSSTTPR